jgi:hypothetical protein
LAVSAAGVLHLLQPLQMQMVLPLQPLLLLLLLPGKGCQVQPLVLLNFLVILELAQKVSYLLLALHPTQQQQQPVPHVLDPA